MPINHLLSYLFIYVQYSLFQIVGTKFLVSYTKFRFNGERLSLLFIVEVLLKIRFPPRLLLNCTKLWIKIILFLLPHNVNWRWWGWFYINEITEHFAKNCLKMQGSQILKLKCRYNAIKLFLNRSMIWSVGYECSSESVKIMKFHYGIGIDQINLCACSMDLECIQCVWNEP